MSGTAGGAPNPRIGGGTDSGTWWTGGSNVNNLTRPKSINARRPSDFKSGERVENNCTMGLPEARHLGTEDDKDATITLTAWINEVREDMETKGMDTVYYVLKSGGKETYLLSDWGAVTSDVLSAWIDDLKSGVPKGDGSRQDVCQFDLDNLQWSARAIKNSITVRLWEEIEPELSYGATGPEIFLAIMRRVQHSSASASRALVKKLEGLKLNKEPGMNVDTFTAKITEIVRRIEGCDVSSIPNDLSTLVAQCFLDTDVDEFKLEASSIFNRVDRNPSAMGWRSIIKELKSKYRSLEGLGRWPHKSKKSPADELAALKGSLNKLTQSVGEMKNGSSGGVKGKRDMSEVVCHNCKEKGHFARDCPKPNNRQSTNGNSSSGGSGNSGGGNSWVRTGPAEGESETKNVDGTEWLWCKRCRRWRKDKNRHTSENHKTKSELTGEQGGNSSGNNAGNNSSGGGSSGNPQSGSARAGGLRMIGGLFCGTLKVAATGEVVPEIMPLNQSAGRC